MPFTGSCHCGALHYSCNDDPSKAMTCNCSICRRKGSVLHFVDATQVRLTADPQAHGVYRFHKHIIAHHFCKTCGIAPWSEVSPPEGFQYRAGLAVHPARLAKGWSNLGILYSRLLPLAMHAPDPQPMRLPPQHGLQEALPPPSAPR